MKSKKISFPKNNKFVHIAALTALIALSSLTGASGDLRFEWGTGIDTVKSSLGGDKNYTQFTPKQKPDYNNKIVSYITAVDEGVIDRIIILRSSSNPVTDYLFVNNKLYTTLEDWGDIDAAKYKSLKDRLDSAYGAPSVQQDGSIIVYSYSDSKSKVIFYTKKVSSSRYSCRIYSYVKQLFRILIVQ